MPFAVIRNDITTMDVDAIVNAASPALVEGGGVSGAIFRAAGAEHMRIACSEIGGCPTGSAVITPGFDLPARYVIHTVGPFWRGGSFSEREQLTACYENSLLLAVRYGLSSIAFPLISSGIYGYPQAEALAAATSAIRTFLETHDMTVWLVVYDRVSFALSETLYQNVARYVTDHYVDTHFISRRTTAAIQSLQSNDMLPDADMLEPPVPETHIYAARPIQMAAAPITGKRKLDELVSALDESFSESLLGWIDRRGMTDVETYRRANVDRKLFSKIRSDRGYRPSKSTAIAFAIALRLNHDETRDLLRKAGFALSRSNRFDIIVEYFITEGIYDIFEINETLFAFSEPLLFN